MHAGLTIIKEEHRALAAVLHGLSYLTAEIEKGRAKPDFVLFHAILHYIREFPDRLHHPKEEQCLFKAVRARTDEAESVIAQLEADHQRQIEGLAALDAALDAYEKHGDAAFPAFARAAHDYAERNFRHMGTEEGVLIPIALRALTDDDWRVVDAAFADNADPMGGREEADEFRALFNKIIALTPAPLGLG